VDNEACDMRLLPASVSRQVEQDLCLDNDGSGVGLFFSPDNRGFLPMQANCAWSPIPSKCLSDVPPVYSSALLNIFADLALLAFVIPKILGLQIAKKQKLSLLGIVCLSILAIIAASVRLARVIHVANSKDVSWDSYDITIWSSVEVNTGIFCASAAAIKPLIRKLSPSFLSSGAGTSRTNGNSRSQMGTYGTGTFSSRRGHNMADGAIELSSQASNSNKFWADRVNTSSSEDSERGVLGLESIRGEIRKTVSVHVTEQVAVEDMGNGVRRFEHV